MLPSPSVQFPLASLPFVDSSFIEYIFMEHLIHARQLLRSLENTVVGKNILALMDGYGGEMAGLGQLASYHLRECHGGDRIRDVSQWAVQRTG